MLPFILHIYNYIYIYIYNVYIYIYIYIYMQNKRNMSQAFIDPTAHVCIDPTAHVERLVRMLTRETSDPFGQKTKSTFGIAAFHVYVWSGASLCLNGTTGTRKYHWST